MGLHDPSWLVIARVAGPSITLGLPLYLGSQNSVLLWAGHLCSWGRVTNRYWSLQPWLQLLRACNYSQSCGPNVTPPQLLAQVLWAGYYSQGHGTQLYSC